MTKHTFIFVWLALAGLIFYLADGIQNPNKIKKLGESSTVVLKRGLDGHYRTEALINGQKVDVLVDTGATGVAISQNVADKLKLSSIDAIRTNTANGDSVGYMVRLQSVKIGGEMCIRDSSLPDKLAGEPCVKCPPWPRFMPITVSPGLRMLK